MNGGWNLVIIINHMINSIQILLKNVYVYIHICIHFNSLNNFIYCLGDLEKDIFEAMTQIITIIFTKVKF